MIDWALNTPLEYQKLPDTNLQGKVERKNQKQLLQERRCILQRHAKIGLAK